MGLRQEELAAKSGVSKQSIGRFERGERSPKIQAAEKLAAVLAVDPQWLLFGTGKAPPGLGSGDRRVGDESQVELVPVLSNRGSAESWPITAAERGAIGGEVRAVVVEDDAMSPLYGPGDLVFFDASDTDYADGLRVIRLGDRILVRRLQLTQKGARILGESAAYAPLEVKREDFVVLGRVARAWKRGP